MTARPDAVKWLRPIGLLASATVGLCLALSLGSGCGGGNASTDAEKAAAVPEGDLPVMKAAAEGAKFKKGGVPRKVGRP
jgi:hypothetical protein